MNCCSADIGQLNINVIGGDTENSLALDFFQEDETKIDLTAFDFIFELKNLQGAVVEVRRIGSGLSLEGNTLYIEGKDKVILPADKYHLGIKLITPQNDVYTIIKGNYRVTEKIVNNE